MHNVLSSSQDESPSPSSYSQLITHPPIHRHSPFDGSSFDQRFDPFTHNYPVSHPPPSPPLPPNDNFLSRASPKGLCIEILDEARIDISRQLSSSLLPQLSDNCEWPANYGYQDPDLDICFDDEGLSTLDRIYLFCRSEAVFHRVFISHALPKFLPDITPSDAVQYVIPLLSGLAMDEEEAVKEALAAELVNIIWWFLTHCRVIEEETSDPDSGAPSTYATPLETPDFVFETSAWSTSSETLISVQTFTPILGTLLLSPNCTVGASARSAVVELLWRIKVSDDKENGVTERVPRPQQPASSTLYEDEDEWTLGTFRTRERKLLENELLYQVVIGMGRLDMLEQAFDDDGLTPSVAEHWKKSPLLTPTRQLPLEKSDSYFPHIPHKLPSRSSSPLPPAVAEQASPDTQSDLPATHQTEVITGSPDPQGSDDSTPDLSPDNSELSPDTTDSSTKSPDTDFVDQYLPQSLANISPGSIEIVLQVDEVNSTHQDGVSLHSLPSEDEQQQQQQQQQQQNKFLNIHSQKNGSENGIHTAGFEGGEILDHKADGDDEQAAVGRLSSMSLMAAVTASGSVAEKAKSAFVKEVQRVGRDPVFWVRREASYALGALAKVVPVEIVVSSLLPLLESLCQDTVWHVRHSALCALPAILSRLSPESRRVVALKTLLPLSEDASSSVRIAVLEALGEVLCSFHEDPESVPQELLYLFVGQGGAKTDNESFDAREQPPRNSYDYHDKGWLHYPSWDSGCSPTDDDYGEQSTIWNDPSRPLICAFNYPAVAWSLGRDRWAELKALYRTLSQSSQIKVKRTLAASLGELARIIGPENATTDLMDVFRASIRAEEGDVRLKTIEAMEVFVAAISDENKWEVVEMLITAWDEDYLNGWRERELTVLLLKVLLELDQDVSDGSSWNREAQLLKNLFMKGLYDGVATVREAAISVAPAFIGAWRHRRPHLLKELLGDIQLMADDPKYSRRMTFISCQQQILLARGDAEYMVGDSAFWKPLERLGSDGIVGVRIGVARLLSEICEKYYRNVNDRPGWVSRLAERLTKDSSKDVRSFVAPIQGLASIQLAKPVVVKNRSSDLPLPSTFSRPPPPLTEAAEDLVQDAPMTEDAEVDTSSDGTRTMCSADVMHVEDPLENTRDLPLHDDSLDNDHRLLARTKRP